MVIIDNVAHTNCANAANNTVFILSSPWGLAVTTSHACRGGVPDPNSLTQSVPLTVSIQANTSDVVVRGIAFANRTADELLPITARITW